MNAKRIEQAKSQDLRGAGTALRRAARRAREIALATRTRLVIGKGGSWEAVVPSGDSDSSPSSKGK